MLVKEMIHLVGNIEGLINPTNNTLDIGRLQEIISDDPGPMVIKFPQPPKPEFGKTYFWPAYAAEPLTCQQRINNSTLEDTELCLDLEGKKVTFKLYGNTIKFFQGTFKFYLNGGKLKFDLGGGNIHCGLQKTRVLDWVDINDHSTPIPVEDASIFLPGDNFQCSFIATNGASNHARCYVQEKDPQNNTITKWHYSLIEVNEDGTKNEITLAEHDIIPPGAYISNKCFFSHSVTINGHGEVKIINGRIIESCGYYLSFGNNNDSAAMEVTIKDIDFSGQFLDGLAFTGGPKENEINENGDVELKEQNGNINAKITKCTFGKSYDIAKQGLMLTNRGKIEIDRCYFARSNHDPDITVFRCPFKYNGDIVVKNSVFNGYNSSFETLRNEFSQLGMNNVGMGAQFKGPEYINDNCLSVIQANSINSIKLENCLFENYSRQLMLSQAHGRMMTIGDVHVKKCIYDAGHPYFFEIGHPDPLSSKLKLTDLRDVVTKSNVREVLFSNCYFTDVDTFCWSSRVEWNAGFRDQLSQNDKDAISAQMNQMSQNITHRNCRFEVHRESFNPNPLYTSVLKNPNFQDTTIIKYTNSPMYLGQGAAFQTSPSFTGFLKIVLGTVVIGFKTKNRTIHLTKIRIKLSKFFQFRKKNQTLDVIFTSENQINNLAQWPINPVHEVGKQGKFLLEHSVSKELLKLRIERLTRDIVKRTKYNLADDRDT